MKMAKTGRKYPPEMTRKKMIDWCNKAERSQWDVRKKLQDWQIPSLERENIIAELIEMNLLNEKRYASAFANDKSRFNRWGSAKIRAQLHAKGISERNIQDALKEIDAGDTALAIQQLIEKKLPSLKGLKTWQKKYKIMQYLSGKGFQRDEMENLIDQKLGNSE